MNRIKRYYSAFSRYHKSNGYGIHSPFAFKFVLDILKERLPYYCYQAIEETRTLVISDLKKSGTKHPHIISTKNAKLVFRVTNAINPKYVLQIGTNYGVSTACMMMVSSTSQLYLYDNDINHYSILNNVIEPFKARISPYESIAEAIKNYTQIINSKGENPYILINSISKIEVSSVIKYLTETVKSQCTIIMRNLSSSKNMEHLWTETKLTAKFGMSFSNEKIVVFIVNPKLPRQDFLLWF